MAGPGKFTSGSCRVELTIGNEKYYLRVPGSQINRLASDIASHPKLPLEHGYGFRMIDRSV